MTYPRLNYFFLTLLIFSSCSPTQTPTPKVIVVKKEVFATRIIETPTPAVMVVTSTRPGNKTTEMQKPTAEMRSHDWLNFGGICMRPDNLPDGVSISEDRNDLEDARRQILEALWQVIEKNGSAQKMIPSFSSFSRFEQGIGSGTLIRGPILPVGKTPPRSDPWSFYLEDAETVWRKSHPTGTFRGVDLTTLCLEFVSPFDFEREKRIKENPAYLHLVGGVTHAIFAMDDIFESPRMVIKLYQNPYGGKNAYQYLLGISPENTPEENAEAANEHVSALVATLHNVLWGSFDGDGVFEFGYGPKNSAPLPAAAFQILKIFIPVP